MDRSALEGAYVAAVRYLENVSTRRVGASADLASMRAELGGPLPERGEPADRVVEQLARNADPGIVASAGPRFFGFVIGGSLPAAVGADWLTSAWDQNAGLFVLSPAAAIVEDTVLEWLTDLFGLPPGTGIGFVTGGQMRIPPASPLPATQSSPASAGTRRRRGLSRRLLWPSSSATRRT